MYKIKRGTSALAISDASTLDPLSIDDLPLSIDAVWNALEQVSAEHQGEITSLITDGEGNAIPCVVGIRTREFPGGLGIEGYRDGVFSWIFDPSGPGSKRAPAMAQEIAHYYAVFLASRHKANSLQPDLPRAQSGIFQQAD